MMSLQGGRGLPHDIDLFFIYLLAALLPVVMINHRLVSKHRIKELTPRLTPREHNRQIIE